MIKPKSRGWQWSALVAIAFVAGAACGGNTSSSGTAGKTIKIGFVYPLSGTAAIYGQRAKEAAAIALDEVNAPGYLPNGMKIDALFEDSKADPQAAVSAGQLLAERDNVDVLVPDTSSDTLAMLPLGPEYKIPLVNALASARQITQQGNKYIFRIIPTETQQNLFLADYLSKSLDKPSVVIGYETSDQGVGQMQAFSAQWTKDGGRVLDTVGWDPNTTDFSSLATRLISKHPQLIYAATAITPMVELVKALQEQGNQATVTSTVWLAYPTFEQLAGTAANGHIRLLFWMASTDPSAGAQTVNFTKKFEQRYGKEPDYNHAQVYDTIKLIADAIKRGGHDRASILAALRATKNYQGLMGPITFDQSGQVVLTPKSMTIIKTVDGKAVVLKQNP